jgi:hypothetical protein
MNRNARRDGLFRAHSFALHHASTRPVAIARASFSKIAMAVRMFGFST